MSFNKTEKAYIVLNYSVDSIKKQEKLLDLYSCPSQIIDNIKSDRVKIEDITGREDYNELLNYTLEFEKIENSLYKKGINVLTIDNPLYPEALKHIDGPPKTLYYLGNINLINSIQVAVVGTRKYTAYGKRITETFCSELAKSGVTITSGLALGIDTFAHKEALKAKGKTIAVLGGGLDILYPSQNKNLANEIADKGLLLTEYPPHVNPTKYSFPQRNRIVSGLSSGVLVTEAPLKSGALITVNLAIEQGREIFAVPGSIFSEYHSGVNNLIKHYPQAIVLTPQDILSRLNIVSTVTTEKKNQPIALTFEETAIVDYLTKEGMQHIDKISSATNTPLVHLNSILSLLQIKGIVNKAGNTYRIS